MPVENTIRFTHEPTTHGELHARLERIDARIEQLTAKSTRLAHELLAIERTDGEVNFVELQRARNTFGVLRVKILNLHVKRASILGELAEQSEQTA